MRLTPLFDYSRRKSRSRRSVPLVPHESRIARFRRGSVSALTTRFGESNAPKAHNIILIVFCVLVSCSYNAKRRHWRRTKLGI